MPHDRKVWVLGGLKEGAEQRGEHRACGGYLLRPYVPEIDPSVPHRNGEDTAKDFPGPGHVRHRKFWTSEGHCSSVSLEPFSALAESDDEVSTPERETEGGGPESATERLQSFDRAELGGQKLPCLILG